jgi:hypothetical protein
MRDAGKDAVARRDHFRGAISPAQAFRKIARGKKRASNIALTEET